MNPNRALMQLVNPCIDVVQGLDHAVDAMARVFHGRHEGVQLVQIGPERLS